MGVCDPLTHLARDDLSLLLFLGASGIVSEIGDDELIASSVVYKTEKDIARRAKAELYRGQSRVKVVYRACLFYCKRILRFGKEDQKLW